MMPKWKKKPYKSSNRNLRNIDNTSDNEKMLMNDTLLQYLKAMTFEY